MKAMDFAKKIIEGSGGLNDYQDHEMVVFHVSDRVMAAHWTLRSLANPECKGSEEAIQAIIAARKTTHSEIDMSSISDKYVDLAQQALDAWDGQDTAELFLLLGEHLGLSLYEMRNMIQAKMDADAATYRAEMKAMENT